MKTFTSFADVVDAFGGAGPFGEAVGIPANHARTMKARQSIPAGYWADLVKASEAKGISGLTVEVLSRLAAERDRRGDTLIDTAGGPASRNAARV